ncbi:hypothetical protein [Crenothrix polyspora]|uniref:Uncharacterized protein n=1 Tax=Crenothrix polyspora TaxID=360316 RepID=A0A1R4HAW4_9GAMM|nr:hypothetical protein [Crenothrix polyspora]SJM93327.1 exported hypothetical protein [Crenothrix polyspora]
MNIWTKLSGGLILLAGSTVSYATVIDFQNIVTPVSVCANVATTLSTQGYSFTGNPATVDSNNLYICHPNVIQHNPTFALINGRERSILTMTKDGGAAFTLQSFFAGGRTRHLLPNLSVQTPYSPAQSIDILGNLIGGISVSHTVTLDSAAPYDWAKYILPASFTNLLSVTLTAQGGLYPEFLIDDIVVTKSVPETRLITLFLIGLAGLFLSQKWASRVMPDKKQMA